jgi:magnesium transporter
LKSGVVDDNHRLVGVLTVDDMVDVIHEEADRGHQAAGRRGRRRTCPTACVDTVRSRAPWLVVNLIAAMLASFVISPVQRLDRADGGARGADADRRVDGRQCRGTQTMTVTVRALATRDLDRTRLKRLIIREMSVRLCSTAASSRCCWG